jgi:uncharacterized protein (TIGR03089 family)
MSDMATTLREMISSALASAAARPMLTFYDDANGERVELSGATMANWVAKTANLLVDAAGAEAGEPVAIDLPPHWQTAAILLGSWTAGVVVDLSGGKTDVSFGTTAGTYVLGFAPMAMPIREVPLGHLDYIAEVRAQGDVFLPYQSIEPVDLALVTPAGSMSNAEVCAAATGLWRPSDRLLVDGDAVTDPVRWLLAPIAAGASIVLCRNTDPAKLPGRRESERVTADID